MSRSAGWVTRPCSASSSAPLCILPQQARPRSWAVRAARFADPASSIRATNLPLSLLSAEATRLAASRAARHSSQFTTRPSPQPELDHDLVHTDPYPHLGLVFESTYIPAHCFRYPAMLILNPRSSNAEVVNERTWADLALRPYRFAYRDYRDGSAAATPLIHVCEDRESSCRPRLELVQSSRH
ncbi:hypothetical protein F4780DRAFT_713232 [Xylariomycetidae sp. FL0641]|nr:hypothetical protein F4780DRAFT_713232 [Xylariomycetidae sp. FL0641]